MSKGGAVMRTLASHQCGPGLNPGIDAINGLSLLLLLPLALTGFSPGTPVLTKKKKTTLGQTNYKNSGTDSLSFLTLITKLLRVIRHSAKTPCRNEGTTTPSKKPRRLGRLSTFFMTMIVCEKEVTNLNYVWHSHLMSSSCPISCTAGKIGFLVNSSPSMQLNKKKFLVKQNFAKIPLTVFLNLISIKSK